MPANNADARQDSTILVVNRGVEPSTKLRELFGVVGNYLWDAIDHSGYGDGSFGRCVLTSCSTRDFFTRRGYKAEVISAVLEVTLRRGRELAHPTAVAIGEPTSTSEGLHVVCRLKDGDRNWIIDCAARQASRPGRWPEPPEAIFVEEFAEPKLATTGPEYLKGKYLKLANAAAAVGDGSQLLFQWFHSPEHPDIWKEAADALPERSAHICGLLEYVCQQSGI